METIHAFEDLLVLLSKAPAGVSREEVGYPRRGGLIVAPAEQLTSRIADLVAEMAEVQEAYLFGSCARGARQPHSDVDVAVFVDEAVIEASDFGYRADLTTALMSGLGTNQVDVVVLNDAPPLLYHRVLRDGIRVFSRDLQRTTGREGRALSRFCDYLPQLSKIDAALRFAASGKSGSP